MNPDNIAGNCKRLAAAYNICQKQAKKAKAKFASKKYQLIYSPKKKYEKEANLKNKKSDNYASKISTYLRGANKYEAQLEETNKKNKSEGGIVDSGANPINRINLGGVVPEVENNIQAGSLAGANLRGRQVKKTCEKGQ